MKTLIPALLVAMALPAAAQQAGLDLDLDLSIRAGLVFYSGEFEADPEGVASLRARLALPWASELIGASAPRALGAFLEAGLSAIDRDLDLEDPSGTVMLAGAGVDWIFLEEGPVRFSTHLGVAFAAFGDVTGVDDGPGLLLGGEAGVRVSDSVRVTYSPEIVAGGGDWLFLNQVGVSIGF